MARTLMIDELHVTLRVPANLPAARAAAAHRGVGCPDTRADLVAETGALAWRHFARLVDRGKNPERFVTTLDLRSTQAVRAGRPPAGRVRPLEGCALPGGPGPPRVRGAPA